MERVNPSAVFLLFCVLISPAAGHDCHGGCHCGNGWHRDDCCSRGARQSQGSASPSRSPAYAAAAPKVVDGEISEIVYLPGATADSAMVQARVLVGGRVNQVQLVPVGVLKQNQLVLREGDTVSVTGFEVSGTDGDLLVATEIRKGDKRVVMRDARGRPVW